jgi:hypothetical protein
LTLVVRLFLSSTYEDLVAEREAVYERLTAEGHDVVRMEDFGSRDTVPLDTCLDALETCEGYVLLLGSRYGSIELERNLSYTEVEYERARELGLPVLAYVRDGIDSPTGRDPDDYLRLRDFHEVVERGHTVHRPYFTSADELAEHVAQDLARLAATLTVRPSFGRVRRSIETPLAYAGRSVRYTRLMLNPLVVVFADLAVLDVEDYPKGRGRRMRNKVRDLVAQLGAEGVNTLVFNDIPAPGLQPLVDQRLAEVRDRADVVVALIHGRSDAPRLGDFEQFDGIVAAWYPDHVEPPEVDGVRAASYTQEQLQRCTLALNVQRYLESVIDGHLARNLA